MSCKCAISVLCAVALTACGSNGEEEPKVSAMLQASKDEARARCVKAPSEEACVLWGRLALSAFPEDVEKAEAERAEIGRLAASLKSEELMGVEGAYLCKIGSLHARNRRFGKAMETSRKGMDLLRRRIQEYPKGKAVRIYYVAAISNLPPLFGKRKETLDSIASLRARFRLTDAEALVLQDAQKRVQRQ